MTLWGLSEKAVICKSRREASGAAAKLLQSCPTLCDPIDGSPPGSPVPGILQARTLDWVAISFSNAWKWKVKVKSLSRVRLLVTPWTAAYQAPPSMGFSRQEKWSGVPLPSPSRHEAKQRDTSIWRVIHVSFLMSEKCYPFSIWKGPYTTLKLLCHIHPKELTHAPFLPIAGAPGSIPVRN